MEISRVWEGKTRNIHENVMEISGGFETLFLDQHADDWNLSAIPSPPLTNTVCGKKSASQKNCIQRSLGYHRDTLRID